MELFRSHILICGGTGCTSSGSAQLLKRSEELLEQNGLTKEIKLVHTGCFGLCEAGPVVIVYPEGAFYSRVTPEDIPEVVAEHLVKGRIVTRLLYDETVQTDCRRQKTGGRTMDVEKIDRINALAHKAKSVGLTEEEKKERELLRKEYIASVRMNLRAQLDNVDVQQEDGTIINLGEKYGIKKRH